MKLVDLRSDTVTRPTPEMRRAMAQAEVGDDVLSDDPTALRLQELLAEMLGKEAALFVPSGTMSNQIGLRVHCRPGDEFICETNCHIYCYEQGAYAQLSGLVSRTVTGECGVLRLEQLQGLIRGGDDHLVTTRLVCLENTHNRGGGKILPYDEVERICHWAHEQGLATHLDGARLFNAVVASGIPATKWAQHFDTINICFSKGLGAPIGSALVGSKALIAKAHRARKLFGGGMRQVGIIAAGALYALEHNIQRLAEDHIHAQILADTIRQCPGLELKSPQVDTNLVIFHIDPKLGTAEEFANRLETEGVLTYDIAAQSIRVVTHLDVNTADVKHAAAVIEKVATKR